MIKIKEFKGNNEQKGIESVLNRFFDTKFEPGREMIVLTDYSVDAFSGCLIAYDRAENNKVLTLDFVDNGSITKNLIKFQAIEVNGTVSEPNIEEMLNKRLEKIQGENYVLFDIKYAISKKPAKNKEGKIVHVNVSNALVLYGIRENG